MVALLGFVVTIGVLVVQQATGTLSPRYMRLWYRDRLQKAVLATFAGTITFAFSLLRRINDDFVPDIGVTVAGIVMAASLGLLLIYLNRFTHNLRPVAVAAIVARPGRRSSPAGRQLRAGVSTSGPRPRPGRRTGVAGAGPTVRCGAGRQPAGTRLRGGPARLHDRAHAHGR